MDKVQGNRNIKIDILRGLGIVLMIYGHAAKYTSFIALFHMALFFIASGYCFNEKKLKTIKDVWTYIVRKIKHLWIPYFVYETIFVLLHNFFIDINIYTNNNLFLTQCDNSITKLFFKMTPKEIIIQIVRNALFQGDTQIGGALWFLQTLFFTTVIFGLLHYLFNTFTKSQNITLFLQGIVSGIFLFGGYYCQIYNITAKHLDRVLTVYWMIYVGFLIKKYSLMDKLFDKINYYACCISSLFILAFLFNYGRISLNGNLYPNPIYLIIVSILGWIMIYSTVEIIYNKMSIGKYLQYISIHSMPILALHFLAFKLVTLLYIILYRVDFYMLAAFPVLSYEIIWCIIYIFCGLALPLLLDYTIIIIRKKIKRI